jgi:hypothetical protein
MEQICNIVDSYHILQGELDRIDRNIRKSDFANSDGYKPPAYNFFIGMAIMVVQMRAELAKVESDVIEAEFACDPDMKEVETHEAA